MVREGRSLFVCSIVGWELTGLLLLYHTSVYLYLVFCY